MYQNVARLGQRFFSRAFLFKYGFNFSPMYRRSCSRVVDVAKDLKTIRIRLKYSYMNINYVGSIFGVELEEIRKRVQQEKEIEIIKSTSFRNNSGDTVFCTVDKTLYIADKQYFKAKRKKRSQEKTSTS